MKSWGKFVPKQPVEVPVAAPVQAEEAKPKKTTKKKAVVEE